MQSDDQPLTPLDLSRPADKARTSRSLILTAHVTVQSDADLGDPFIRVAVFTSLVDQLRAAQLVLDTPHGGATAAIGLVTAVS
jgi:hypothetical protein